MRTQARITDVTTGLTYQVWIVDAPETVAIRKGHRIGI